MAEESSGESFRIDAGLLQQRCKWLECVGIFFHAAKIADREAAFCGSKEPRDIGFLCAPHGQEC